MKIETIFDIGDVVLSRVTQRVVEVVRIINDTGQPETQYEVTERPRKKRGAVGYMRPESDLEYLRDGHYNEPERDPYLMAPYDILNVKINSFNDNLRAKVDRIGETLQKRIDWLETQARSKSLTDVLELVNRIEDIEDRLETGCKCRKGKGR